ncbi:error-prone DNA polymerase [Cognatilysobacter segetis]|uniref:error-prone DNA polymerase n=1 Tax=Cognatilysobacter segetis TaxID=2492394 RepID=UPI002368EB75|nr:error-prone DNA polymerase [Lysobacter segetis]
MPAYAELHCLSCFSFQRGASTAKELFARARQQGYRALAITDECSLAGIVRAYQAAKESDVPLIVGSEFRLEDGPRCVLLVESAPGYEALCDLVTRARRRAKKGTYRALAEDFDRPLDGLLALWLPGAQPDEAQARWLQARFPQRAWLAVELHRGPDDAARLQQLLVTASRLGMPAVAAGDVHMHVRRRRALQDTMTAIRLRTPLADAGYALFPNGERHLRTRQALASLYPAALMEESVRIADRCRFSLDALDYRYPRELVPDGDTPATRLRALVEDGFRWRFPCSAAQASAPSCAVPITDAVDDAAPAGRPALPDAYVPLPGVARLDAHRAANDDDALRTAPARNPQMRASIPASTVVREVPPAYRIDASVDRGPVRCAPDAPPLHGETARPANPYDTPANARATRELIEKELAIIGDLKYESYFLTVHDIVRFARSRDILCQGRGSAANSAVCYVLGITELRPGQIQMLFERFVSRERNEPPDIDVDFEHERREDVLQYIFDRYGRDRAALTAVAIQYRGRSAVRDVAKALGLPSDQIDELARTMDRWSASAPMPEYLRERGFDPDSPVMQRLIVLTQQLMGMPRHLSQHPGGFVISERPLSTLVPVENAAMDGRTIIQWDKDDLDEMGLLKVDCLALGMLTCVRKTVELLRKSGRRDMTVADIPPECPKTYAMIQPADTLGVFQIESRAQMAMLPRLKPKTFYDLVIQVAIVRPGPIQGDMVHPYLRRRNSEEAVTYPSEALRAVFERTLGVPLFQEQVMQLAIVAAGYTPGEADQLRRSMAAWKRHGGMEHHRQRIVEGMLKNGYAADFAERVFEQIKGFGSYGFPESHAASFALITYMSCWLKCHEPAAFAAALLNSQPMGFYSPSQIVQDARRHGIEMRPVDIRYSDWDCSLEFRGDPADLSTQPALRLGLRMVDGLSEPCARRIEAARGQAAFTDATDLCLRASLDRRERGLLADAGALKSLLGHRHKARWAVAGVEAQRPLFEAATPEAPVALPLPSVEDDVRTDYDTLGLTLGRHPLALLRSALSKRRCVRSRDLKALPNGRRVMFAGLVTLRQRPQTASGVTFLTLEDEDGLVNAVVWRQVAEQYRRVLLETRLLVIHGHVESQDGVQHVIAKRLENLDALLGPLATSSRDFH